MTFNISAMLSIVGFALRLGQGRIESLWTVGCSKLRARTHEGGAGGGHLPRCSHHPLSTHHTPRTSQAVGSFCRNRSHY